MSDDRMKRKVFLRKRQKQIKQTGEETNGKKKLNPVNTTLMHVWLGCNGHQTTDSTQSTLFLYNFFCKLVTQLKEKLLFFKVTSCKLLDKIRSTSYEFRCTDVNTATF